MLRLIQTIISRGCATGLKMDPPHCAGTMADVKAEIIKRLGLSVGYQPLPKSREHLLKYTPKSPDELPKRTMRDSYTSAIIPLKTDVAMQDRYIAFLGQVRLGRLMEDMDLFAVWVCHKHVLIPSLPENIHLPYTFVTILVDKVDFPEVRTKATEDIRMSGHVTWVGRSSMEVAVWLEQIEDGQFKVITKALFLMGSRNATNTASAPVNQIEPANEDEEKILAGGEKRKKERFIKQAASVFKTPPSEYEQAMMYNIFTRTTDIDTMEMNKRILPANCRWMTDGVNVNTFGSFPENRNAHNTVFGGFIMRNAYEISWCCAYLYCKSRPKIRHICDISFHKPISVFSFVKISAYVVYTEANYLQMMTSADVLEPTTGKQMTSDTFFYTFSFPDNVPEVLPQSYHETMWYIEGRRKFRYSVGLNDEHKQKDESN